MYWYLGVVLWVDFGGLCDGFLFIVDLLLCVVVVGFLDYYFVVDFGVF